MSNDTLLLAIVLMGVGIALILFSLLHHLGVYP